ncbi:hypothetical protein CICLE_v10009160mg [Citrus x clementina]|uniref:RING-type domain-containing protein n=3 Tax=Citrus TaxID=2706 RepID=A0ACB8P5J6_CITSI|nr:hypothetical protein CICLE_v10009160mg [Citrus x clementina]KAH9804850.1 RING-type domain-containing protein [Citrus sinensis]
MEATQTSHSLTLKKRLICYASPRSSAATHPPETRKSLEFNFQELVRFSMTENEMASSTRSETSRSFVCEICVETKQRNESFSIKGCSHTYCVDCTVKYVDSKLQENVTSIGCPVADCGGSLEPEYCRDILPEEAFDKWGKALCESLIPGAQKFYCPFKDCSALLIDDAGEAIRESECPNCHRLFCAQCKVAWHAGIECADFQKLHKDEPESEDIILMKLAQNQKWNRCPNCKFYVEKKDGCSYIRCRCGHAFCYHCGVQLSTVSHGYYCPSCNK